MSNALSPLQMNSPLKSSKIDLVPEKIVLKIVLPRGQTTAIAVASDTRFMEILDRICQKRNIPMNKHVLFINVLEQMNDEDTESSLEPQIESILVDLNQKLSEFQIKSIELCEDQHAEVVQARPTLLQQEQSDVLQPINPASPTKLIQERRASRIATPLKPISPLKEDKNVIKSFFGKYASPTSGTMKKKKTDKVDTSATTTATTITANINTPTSPSPNEFKTLGRNMMTTLKRSPTQSKGKDSSTNSTNFDNLELQANQTHDSPSNNAIAPWDDPPSNQSSTMDDIAPFANKPSSSTTSTEPFQLFKQHSDSSSLHDKSIRAIESDLVEGRNSIYSLPLSEDMSTNSQDIKINVRKKSSMTSMTLRKQTLTKKSRSAIQQAMESYIIDLSDSIVTDVPQNVKMVKLNISLDNKQTVLKCSQETILDDLLKYMCDKKGVNYQEYTFEAELNDKILLELDRPISFYTERFQVYDYCLTPGDKEYTIRSFLDGDKEVALYQKTTHHDLLMAATLERLVDILTAVDLCDEEFLDTFLMSYRSFLKPVELFDTLLSRFDAQLPDNATPEELDYYKHTIGHLQSQILKIFDVWIVKYWFDFAVNSDLKNDLIDVLDSLSIDPYLGDRSIQLIEAVASENEKFENLVNLSKANNSKSKSLDSMLMQYSSDDIAEQLCLVDSQLYQSIHPIEFLNYIWRKKGEEDEYPTPMLDRFISRFDNESYWVATEICDAKDLKKRTQILTQFILVAKKCIDSNNFFSAFSLLGGLSMLPVERLKKTWKGLNNETKKAYEEVQKFCDPSKNMKNYRDKLGIALPPIVPFLRTFLFI